MNFHTLNLWGSSCSGGMGLRAWRPLVFAASVQQCLEKSQRLQRRRATGPQRKNFRHQFRAESGDGAKSGNVPQRSEDHVSLGSHGRLPRRLRMGRDGTRNRLSFRETALDLCVDKRRLPDCRIGADGSNSGWVAIVSLGRVWLESYSLPRCPRRLLTILANLDQDKMSCDEIDLLKLSAGQQPQ